MGYQFRKHYTVQEARRLLPKIRLWFEQLDRISDRLRKLDRRLSKLLEQGRDLGGDSVNEFVALLAQARCLIQEFSSREIVVQDLERGLIDFPAILGGREVFLCWEKGEDDIEYWHDLDAGYAGRQPL
jgi:hypothetical protein